TAAFPTILYVGRLERRKGVETLARAVPTLLQIEPRTKLRFVGGDHPSANGGSSMRAELQKILQVAGPNAAAAVEFTGPVSRTDLPQIYRESDICVIPSLYENFPYTC